MSDDSSRVPAWLGARLVAVCLLAGLGGGGAIVATRALTNDALRDQYVRAVAADEGTSPAVKIAMVMGSYYESSGKHIGTPYIDKLGKGMNRPNSSFACCFLRVFGGQVAAVA